MARHPSTYAPVLKGADHFDPRMRVAVVKVMLRVRSLVSVRELASAIAAKDSRRAVSYIRSIDTRSALAEATTPVLAAFAYGGKVGATRVKKRRPAKKGSARG